MRRETFAGTGVPRFAPPRARRRLTIGLLNNMSDAALHATEQQFARLLSAARGRFDVRLKFYALPEIPRGEHTHTYMQGLYEEAGAMFAADLDGLIVAGAEPRAERLEDEAYWPSLARVIDWAASGAVAGSYWSCLAAHAAVLRLDGVERERLPAKLSGVFESERTSDDPLAARLPAPVLAPHSRLNTLDAAALREAGYTVLTQSDEAGVDLFARRGASLMLFSQGHPEYDADTLLREYCRDAGRYLCGKRDATPAAPAHYLNRRTERAFAAAGRRRRDPALIARYNAIAATATPRKVWRASAVALFRGWLAEIAAARSTAMTGCEGPRARVARPGFEALPA